MIYYLYSRNSRDFSTEENQKSALKNAFAALSKQQYNKAICFLLLANKQTEALQVCVKVVLFLLFDE